MTDDVRWGSKTAKRVLTIAEVVWIGFLIATVLLVTASTLLIANTIRLSIFSRRREIEVMKLVGATNWFVRGPFMLEGLICGLGGSILAVVLLVLGKEIALPSILPHIGGGSDVHALPVRAERALAARGRAPPGGGRLRPHPQALPPGLAPLAPGRVGVYARAVLMRRPLILLAVGLALAGPFVVGYGMSRSSRATTRVAISPLVDQVREALDAQYYRPLPRRCCSSAPSTRSSRRSAIRTPPTSRPADYKLVRQETASTYSGIGISVLPSAARLRRDRPCAPGLRCVPACGWATRSCASAMCERRS